MNVIKNWRLTFIIILCVVVGVTARTFGGSEASALTSLVSDTFVRLRTQPATVKCYTSREQFTARHLDRVS